MRLSERQAPNDPGGLGDIRLDRATALTRARYDRIARLYDVMEAPAERRYGRWPVDNVRRAGFLIEQVENLGLRGIFKLIVARNP